MANQIAFLVHCRPGDEIIADELYRVVTRLGGGRGGTRQGGRLPAVRCSRHLQRRKHLIVLSSVGPLQNVMEAAEAVTAVFEG